MTRPTHTTVVAYLALFIALGTGTAFAASHLAKNSVGPKQLKKNSVTGPKIKKDAITSAKVKDASLLGADLADGTITGAKVADASLTQSDFGAPLRAGNVIGVALDNNCGPAAPFPAGVTAHSLEDGCRLHFESSVINCAATATVNFRTDKPIVLAQRSAQILRAPEILNELTVITFVADSPVRLPVDLTLAC